MSIIPSSLRRNRRKNGSVNRKETDPDEKSIRLLMLNTSHLGERGARGATMRIPKESMNHLEGNDGGQENTETGKEFAKEDTNLRM